jgi:tetratricopeptide (TPR) repeat protein
MTRAIDAPDVAIHLDFLHPARHLWRLRFDSLRLAELERCVLNSKSLGWSRKNDIDPTRIPSIYFDYLRGGPTEPLGGVFCHNRMDLRGLAALAGQIMRTTAAVDVVEPSEDVGVELYGLSRLLAKRGEYLRAQNGYERAIASRLPDEIDQKARYELARIAKRHKNFDRAVELWCGLCERPGLNLEAHEQLAIHYERCAGDMYAAERVTRSGITKLLDASRSGFTQTSRSDLLLARFERRLGRLRQGVVPRRRTKVVPDVI